MKYSYEYKIMSIDLYRQGKWPETPKSANKKEFRHMIREWVRIPAGYIVVSDFAQVDHKL